MEPEENALEHALRLASTDAAYRPDFYKSLLGATVYLLSPSGPPASGATTIQAGEKIAVENWTRSDGSRIIPFFTSLVALQRAIDRECRYMTLPARSFFSITAGESLVLNPKSAYGKEFLPDEIEALLTSGVNHIPEQRVTQAETRVLLGQPANYPSVMVAALTKLLKTRPTVKAAYLFLMHDTAHDEKPHLVIGIEADGDVEQLIREVWVVAGDTVLTKEPLYVVRITHGEPGLSEYARKEVKPFYLRR